MPELGLVCITASNQVRYRTLTRKRLLQLEPAAQHQALRELYAENLRRFELAIDFCQAQQIRLYRLTSALFPFADDSLGEAVLTEFAEPLQQLGDRIQSASIRVVLHPDQFVVLNSDRPDVIANSIKILTTHARIFDLIGLPQSQWAAMNIHGGKGDRADRLISVIRDLPAAIHSRLTLENDEYTYSAEAILAICQAAQVAMVFDAHHHVIHAHLDSYEHPSVAQMLAAAQTTWTNPDWQLVHISNGCEFFTDPRHSDVITEMPSAYWNAPWIEVEAKLKEQAIAGLRQNWLPNALTQPTIPRAIAKS
ncbi:UV DNA damage repair endonuclease UvsE [Pantanalinema rosaneae CENA516]|uniref:UV DNA damage repair endonuclease UvsE n=1 Tax=Pantanalinema rosaneae TaxID=1620701 RepID=UPI003D6F7E82